MIIKITTKGETQTGKVEKGDGIVEYQVCASDVSVSDGYYTMAELYDHRCSLFLALAKSLVGRRDVWRSLRHDDGKKCSPGSFVMGIVNRDKEQIRIDLPMKYWKESVFARDLAKAPAFDKQSHKDVITRLKKL